MVSLPLLWSDHETLVLFFFLVLFLFPFLLSLPHLSGAAVFFYLEKDSFDSNLAQVEILWQLARESGRIEESRKENKRLRWQETLQEAGTSGHPLKWPSTIGIHLHACLLSLPCPLLCTLIQSIVESKRHREAKR